VFGDPQHAYTRHLLAAEPKGKPARPIEGAPIVMRAEDLKVYFPIKAGVLRHTVDHVRAVDGVSIQIREGQTVGVVGESGSGKTTLGLALLRLISSDGGIRFGQSNIQNWQSKQLRPLRREMQIIFQDPFGSLSPRMSIAQIIEEGLKVHAIGDSKAEREALIAQALEEVSLEPESRFRYPHEFSGGQRQRVAIVRALINRPALLLVDEPTGSLDSATAKQIMDLLIEMNQAEQTAMLMVTHATDLAHRLDQTLRLAQGQLTDGADA